MPIREDAVIYQVNIRALGWNRKGVQEKLTYSRT
jgi:hypothetical protein